MSVCLCGEKPHTSDCPAFEGWDEDPAPLRARIAQLEAERGRYREALERIAADEFDTPEIARAALAVDSNPEDR